MTFQEYQQAALRTAPSPDGNFIEDLNHGAMGVCTEGGEIMDVCKKFRYYGKPVDFINVREEIGDVLWYLALLCRSAETSLEEVAQINIAKLRARYPEKFSSHAALNRNLANERSVLEAGQ